MEIQRRSSERRSNAPVRYADEVFAHLNTEIRANDVFMEKEEEWEFLQKLYAKVTCFVT
mgnify:CR=1 FL=1